MNWKNLHLIQLRQNVLNYVPMKPGNAYAAFELRDRHGVALGQYAAAFYVQTLLSLALAFALAGAALLITGLGHSIGIAVAFLLVGFATLSVLWVPLPLSLQKSGRAHRFLSQLRDGLRLMAQSPRNLFFACSLTCLALVLNGLRFQILLASTTPIDFFAGILFAASAQVSVVVSVTPAGLGVREAVLGAVAVGLSLPVAAGVIVSTVDRVLTLSYCVVLLAISAGWSAFERVARLGQGSGKP